MKINVRQIDRITDCKPDDIPSLFRSSGIEYHSIDKDNWNWASANPEVSFAIAHCGGKIALHFHVKDFELRAKETCDDGRVWEDSCCEFFVSPDCNDFYYNFECNCIGTLLLHGGVRPDRPSAPQSCYDAVARWSSLGSDAIGKHKERVEWDLVEIIPVSAFFRHDIKSLHGLDMKANFYKCGDLLDSPHFLSWAPIDLPEPMFHCPDFFGELKFE